MFGVDYDSLSYTSTDPKSQPPNRSTPFAPIHVSHHIHDYLVGVDREAKIVEGLSLEGVGGQELY